MNRRRGAVVLAVVLLAISLAGCSIPTPGNGTGPQQADNASVVDSGVVNQSSNETTSDPPADSDPLGETWAEISEDRVYNQTARLLGSDAPTPEVTLTEFDYQIPAGQKPIFSYLGLTDPAKDTVDGSVLGVASGSDSIRINETFATMNRSERQTDASLTLVLVHEFAHTIQSEKGWDRPDWTRTLPAERGSIERRLLYRTLTEGGAVYTADAYAERIGSERSQIGRYERRYRTAPPDEELLLAPYYHGGQYFSTVVDSSTAVADVYEDDPPRTTTELLHPNKTDFEPAPLNITTTVRRTGWRFEESQRAGEMFIHLSIAAHLDIERANRAATGYAGDQLVAFDGENRTQYTWLTHWATSRDAEEFADSLNETLAGRTDELSGHVGVRVLGDRSVAVVTGERAVRTKIALEGTGTDVGIVVQSEDEQSVRSRRGTGPLGVVGV